MKLNPLDYPGILQIPARLEKSAWIEHVPFAHYLVAALQPNRLVELGTHTGVSYCSFCEAARRLGLTKYRSWAVDTWHGDTQAGFYEDSTFENLERHHRQFEEFSKLLRVSFDEARQMLSQESFDVIHIDGLHTYEAVKHDYEHWVDRLSDGGVVLFHDTQVRDRGFGVYKLWNELSAQYPNFEFEHGHGLGILAPRGGTACLSPLLSSSEMERASIREYFAGAGALMAMITDNVLDERSREAENARVPLIKRIVKKTIKTFGIKRFK